jgi:hypothetical protein
VAAGAARTARAYLASLPEERRDDIAAVRAVILDNLPAGYEEAIQSGRRFEQAFKKAGKKLDMGKSCVRFKRAEDLPLHVIGDTIASIGVDEYVAMLRTVDATRRSKPRAAKKTAAKKTAAKKTAAVKSKR